MGCLREKVEMEEPFVSFYTDASALNLQVMLQLGLMKYSGLVTSTSD